MDIQKALGLNVETPAMIVDYSQVKANLKKVQNFADEMEKKLRPHSKTHKIPYLAKKQIELGAVGVCVQKSSEAEVMFNGGIRDITVSNEIVGEVKTDRLASLSTLGCNITVAVDGVRGMADLNASAGKFGLEMNVLLDVDLGMGRCGVRPANAENILRRSEEYRNLKFTGIMAYDGNVADISQEARRRKVKDEAKELEKVIDLFSRTAGEPETVTVGATSTYDIWAEYPFVTELQPGTYVYYDTRTTEYGASEIDELAMGVVATVMSMTHDDHAVLDAGYKSTSIDNGRYPAAVMGNSGTARVVSMSEEHTVLEGVGNLEVGDRVLLLPSHACTTTDQWDYAVVFNRDDSFEKWKIFGRGMRV